MLVGTGYAVLRRLSGGKACEPGFSISMALQLAERVHLEVVKATFIMPDGKSVPHPMLSMGLAEIGGKCSGASPGGGHGGAVARQEEGWERLRRMGQPRRKRPFPDHI